jgi:hypothetical protein
VLKSVTVVLLALFAFGGLSFAATTTKTTSKRLATKHPATRVPASRSRAAVKSPSRTRTGSRRVASRTVRKTPTKASSRSRGSGRTTRVARRSTQQAPTPARYREIQQALADKGYFQGTVDGTWRADSIDALKRFQKDQNLTGAGKLDSLSLIALGLGPKRNLSAQSTTESRPKDDNRRPEGSERP